MLKKSGQVWFSRIFIGILVLFILAIALVSVSNWNGPSSISSAVEVVSTSVMNVLGPLFRFLLNLDSFTDSNLQFLVVLAFIMISVIIIGTLDSINIFADTRNGNLINFVIGIIVSLIGVRFMPPDLWASLTFPSSAFVATMVVGVPFLALGFVSFKVKFGLARKTIWLFYLVVLGYMIAVSNHAIVYLIFAILAGVMMFFDSTVRKFYYGEKAKADIESMVGKMTLKERKAIRDEIRYYQEIIADPNSPSKDRQDARVFLEDLKKQYGDVNRI